MRCNECGAASGMPCHPDCPGPSGPAVIERKYRVIDVMPDGKPVPLAAPFTMTVDDADDGSPHAVAYAIAEHHGGPYTGWIHFHILACDDPTVSAYVIGNTFSVYIGGMAP